MQTYKDDELEELKELKSDTKAFRNKLYKIIADQFSNEPKVFESIANEQFGKIFGHMVYDIGIGFRISNVKRKAVQCLNPRIFKLKWFSCSLILDDKRNYRPIYKLWIDSKLI